MNQNRKRKSPLICDQAPQNLQMDFEKSRSCLNLLKALMGHPFGWVFNQPVDPVKLQIPDYFIIISSPMDLGTIQQKLIKKKYENVGQFSDDVRLTFSNAMVYNPPGNDVHNMAKDLNQVFEKSWKSLELKWNPDSANGNPSSDNGNVNLGRGDEKRRRENPNMPDGNPNLKRENPNLKRENPNLKRGNPNPGNGGSNLKKGNPNLKRENPNLGNGGSNLKRVNPNLGNGNPTFQRPDERKREKPSSEREIPNLSKRLKFVEEANPVVRKNGQISNRASYEDSNRNTGSSMRLPEPKTNGYTGSSVLHAPKRSNGMLQTSASCKSEGPVSVRKNLIRIPINGKKAPNGCTETGCSASQDCSLNGNGCSSSQPTSAPQCSQNEVKEEIDISSRKALREAMLKKRFAGTIIKAQEKILLDQGKEVDPAKMKRERERLEREHLEAQARFLREEKAKIEAAEKAAREKRQQEREAARIELEKMQKTVETDDPEVRRYIERVARLSSYFNIESIGLCRKKDDIYDSDGEEVEEGEIV